VALPVKEPQSIMELLSSVPQALLKMRQEVLQSFKTL
jgi:hypothetical protein